MSYEEFIQTKINMDDGTVLFFIEEDGHLYITDGVKKTKFDIAYRPELDYCYISLAKQQFSLL